MAKWLLVVGPPGECAFVRNATLDGASVAEEFASRGCTDIVAHHMGPGAYAHAKAAGIRVWQADANVTGRAVAERLTKGELRPLAPEGGRHQHRHRHRGGGDQHGHRPHRGSGGH